MATLLGEERTAIVDWYHASEHSCTVAKAVHGDDTPETKGLAKIALDHLWQTGAKPVLEWFDATRPLFWVRNHEITDMWSGPEGQSTAVSFGKTSAQFCAFLVVHPQDNARLYVLNPYSNDYFWIDQKSVGPADRPESQPGQRAPDQNCASADVR